MQIVPTVCRLENMAELSPNRISIVSPVLNEAESLATLVEQIAASLPDGMTCELIFVDDGSTDGSWQSVQMLCQRPLASENDGGPQRVVVRGIRFRRNFGKAAALTAGFRAATCDVVFMMDADLQDDPAEIPRFLQRISAGADVVNGWKRRRLDPWHKVFPSRVFNGMVSWLTGVRLHDHNCGFKCFRRSVLNEIRIYGELHRFIPVLASARGFKIAELEVHHRSRVHGESKYGVRRFLRGFLDLLTVAFLTSFGQRPLHALGAWGLMFFVVGALGLSYLTVLWLLTNVAGFRFDPIGPRPMLAYSVLSLLLGGQMISLGLLAELIVSKTSPADDQFSVVETTG